MTFRIELLISLFAAVIAGVAAGALWWAPAHGGPGPVSHSATAEPAIDDAPSDEEAAPAEPAAEPNAAGPNEAGPDGAKVAAAADHGAPAAAAAGAVADAHANAAGADAAAPEEALLPAQIEASTDTDPSLIARGPGKFAFLLLADAGLNTLLVREGALERDGDGRFSPFAKAKVLARLRGPEARVELLHLGFDREGHATVAHIRIPGTKASGAATQAKGAPLAAAVSAGKAPAQTADPSDAWIEGVVSLAHASGTVRLRAEAPLEPPADAPAAVENADDDVDR